MRTITVKYVGDCRKCGATLPIGHEAIYERKVGIFCPECAPTDTEEIRTYRQEGADRRADKYEEWASKREAKATAQLNSYPEIRHDWAFITQPGHIPFRDRMNKSDNRACESLDIASNMRNKAKSLRHVRVKGDAARADQAKRDAIRPLLKPGMEVDTVIYGLKEIVKINKKTVTVKSRFENFKPFTVDISFLRIPTS